MSTSRFSTTVFLLALIFGFNAVALAESPDYWPTEGWRTSNPERQGMKSGILADMVEFIKERDYKIDNITIIRNGYLILDAYYYPFQKDIKHITHSCTKSITSVLVGIAVDKGYMKGVNQRILEFFPNITFANLDELKRAITLENLLTMGAGLDTRDSYLYRWEGLSKMKRSGDWAKYILDLPMAVAPGEKFEYSNGVSYLLTVLIQKATKMTAMDFARQYLFGPLGIEDVKWRVSPQGINTGWGGMCLKPHDMAKIGWLYLNKGQWEGKQIVSEEWVEASTRGHIRATLFDHYGYQWWIDSAGYYMAVGLEGQYIFVVPQKDMVAVFTSNLPPNRFYVPKKLLDTYIIPAATSSEPLPNNTSEKVRLDSLLDRYAEGPTQGVVWRSERDGVAKDGVFERTAPPTVKFEYPRGSRKEDIKYPNQIMGIKTPEGDIISVFVDDIPQGMKLVDIGPKGYVPLLQNVGTDIQVTSNKEITLKDGNNAYRTDIEWMFQGSYLLNTIVVSAFKDGKWVFLTAQPIFDPAQVAPIVESLVFD